MAIPSFFSEEKKVDRRQSKCISLKFDEVMELKQIIDELQPYNLSMEGEIKLVSWMIIVFWEREKKRRSLGYIPLMGL